VARVRARTEKVEFADNATPDGRDLKISAELKGDHAVGRLRLGSSSADRLVSGKTCNEVISALALIAALAIDPTAVSEADDKVAAAEVPAPTAPARPTGGGAEAQVPQGVLTNAPGIAPGGPWLAVRKPARDRETLGSGGARWIGGAGIQGELGRGLGAGAITLAGASLHAEAGLTFQSPWQVVFRASAVLTQSPTVIPEGQPSTAAATFTLAAGRLDLCPLDLGPESFVLRPCVGLEIGRLEGTAKPVENGSITSLRSGHMLRLATRQNIQGRVRLAPRVWLELEAGTTLPLVRQKFVFLNPNVTVSSVAAVEIGGALGIGVYFP
jgi:hypothetical protein